MCILAWVHESRGECVSWSGLVSVEVSVSWRGLVRECLREYGAWKAWQGWEGRR